MSSTAISWDTGDAVTAQEALVFLLHLVQLCFKTDKLRVVAQDCNLSYMG